MVSGTLGPTAIAGGRLRGDEITFTAGATDYTGRVQGNTMRGTAGGAPWVATRRSIDPPRPSGDARGRLARVRFRPHDVGDLRHDPVHFVGRVVEMR